jgi:EmrB/QacA subfamily drug resistance transporter
MSAASHLSTRIAEKWLVLIAVTLGMLMSLMDMTMVNVAIPAMQAAFDADVQSVQWVVTTYMLAQAIFIPAAPFLARRFGGKTAYVGTLIAFLLGTLLCGFAWDLPSLLGFRLIQGIGGGILLPLTSTLLYQAFGTVERGGAVSKMGMATMAALVIGPVLGGYLVTAWGWQWAFWANVPFGVAAVWFAQRGLRPAQGEAQVRFDVAGFFAIAAGSTALLLAVSGRAAQPGAISWRWAWGRRCFCSLWGSSWASCGAGRSRCWTCVVSATALSPLATSPMFASPSRVLASASCCRSICRRCVG